MIHIKAKECMFYLKPKGKQENGKSLTKLNETVRSNCRICLHHVVRGNELFLKLVQEAEGEDTGVIFSAEHHVTHSQGTNKTIICKNMLNISKLNQCIHRLTSCYKKKKNGCGL